MNSPEATGNLWPSKQFIDFYSIPNFIDEVPYGVDELEISAGAEILKENGISVKLEIGKHVTGNSYFLKLF